MPTNKPMKNQWIEVDGRLIPSTLPQHWNGNDWAITGTDNPLPVANYTKKGNLWLPTSEDNPVPTQVTGSIVEERIAREVSVSAGANVLVAQSVYTNGSKYFSLTISNNTNDDNKKPNHEIEMDYRYVVGNYATHRIDIPFFSGISRLSNYANITKKIESLEGRVHIYLENKDTLDHTYDIWIRRYY